MPLLVVLNLNDVKYYKIGYVFTRTNISQVTPSNNDDKKVWRYRTQDCELRGQRGEVRGPGSPGEQEDAAQDGLDAPQEPPQEDQVPDSKENFGLKLTLNLV